MNIVLAISLNKSVAEIEQLILGGADVNEGEYDDYNSTTHYPLEMAAKIIQPEYALQCSQLLLAHGAWINGPYGGEALHWAAYRGNTQLVRLLIEKGADVHHRSEYGGTHILGACSNSIDILVREQDFLDTIEILIENGCNPKEMDYGGNTPLKYARKYNSIKICDLLEAHGAFIIEDH